MNKPIIPIIVAIILAVGIGAYFIFQKPAFPEPKPPIGRCGDGICDAFEKANPSLCPKDCKEEPSATTTPSPTVTPSSYQDSPFGIHDPIVPEVDSMVDVAAIGAKWVRGAGPTGIVWDGVETQKGKYDWTRPDRIYSEASKNGIRMKVVVLAYNRLDSGEAGFGYLPKNMNWYIDFLQKTVERYNGDGINDASGSPVVDVWEIGNEADISWKDTPKNYALLLKKSYQVIKKANPNAKVAFAGLADPSGIQKFFIPVLDELERIKDSPNDKYFEIAGFHWSGQFEGDYQKEILPTKTYYLDISVNEMKNEMEKRGYKNIPIWIGEMSYNDGKPEELSFLKQSRSEKEQANELLKRYIYSISKGVAKIFWVTLTEWHNFGGVGVNNYFDNVGLINNSANDGQSHKKLAYYTYKKMVELLEGSDWNNIETIQEKDGIYIYKFTKNGKPIWVAWNDNSAEKQITISGITSNQAKITQAVPKYESGKDVANYIAAFNTETKTVSGGKLTITLFDNPVFVEEK